MLQEVRIDLNRVQQLKLTLSARLCIYWLSTLEGKIALRRVEVPLRRVVLVAEPRLTIELIVSGIYRFL